MKLAVPALVVHGRDGSGWPGDHDASSGDTWTKHNPILLNRLPGEATGNPEQKDPSFIERVREDYLSDPVTPYRYIGYTSSGESVNQHWKLARYSTNDLRGPWQELDSPTLTGLSG